MFLILMKNYNAILIPANKVRNVNVDELDSVVTVDPEEVVELVPASAPLPLYLAEISSSNLGDILIYAPAPTAQAVSDCEAFFAKTTFVPFTVAEASSMLIE